MSSSPKKRPKRPKPGSSSPSTWPIEPPQSLFPSKQELLRLVTVVAIACSVALTCNYFAGYFDSSEKPFCDSNLDSVDSLSDSCEPCPSNGECYQGKLECIHGYRKQGKLCVEDGDINETAKKLSEAIESRLCEAYAQFMCDGTGSIWFQADDVWNHVDGNKLMENFGSDNALHLYTKKRTMEIVDKFLDSRTNSDGVEELKCLDSLAALYRPISCQIRQWASEHALILLPVLALLVGCSLLLWKVHQRRQLSKRAEELYHQVCEILEENALMSKPVNGECEPWVVASRLRDHLLLPRERKDPTLWKKVEDLVQEDSRVDRYPKLVRGESKVVWEWQVEGSLSSSRMKKKRDASKLRSPEVKDTKFDQQLYTSTPESKPLLF